MYLVLDVLGDLLRFWCEYLYARYMLCVVINISGYFVKSQIWLLMEERKDE